MTDIHAHKILILDFGAEVEDQDLVGVNVGHRVLSK